MLLHGSRWRRHRHGSHARLCLLKPMTVHAANFSDKSSLNSVVAYAEAVLRTPTPSEKIRLTFEARQRLRADQIPIACSKSGWPTDRLPEFPACEPDFPKLYDPKELPNAKHLGFSLPVAMLHALAHIELGAIDNYCDTIARFDATSHGRTLPNSFYGDLLKVASDEARHFQLLDTRLNELGFGYGQLPAHKALLSHAHNTSSCLAARLAVVPLVQEARALDSGERLVNKLQSVGDKISAQIVHQIVVEEKSHVAYGVKWFTFLCRQLDKDPVQYFHQLALKFFPEGLPGPFDVQARLAANMPPEWYTSLEIQRVTKRSKQRMDTTPANTDHNVDVMSSPRPQASAAVLRDQPRPKVLVLGCVWPERKSSAAGVRTSDLIDMFTSQGYHVLCVSPSRVNDHTKAFEQANANVSFHQIDANQSEIFQRFLVQHPSVELVLYDRFIAEEMYGWQVNRWAPASVLRVLDLQDLHFLRKAREVQFKQSPTPTTLSKASSLDLDMRLLETSSLQKLVIRELASIHRSDLTLFVSSEEQRLLIQQFQMDPSRLVQCDFFYPPIDKAHLRPFAARHNVAFIGSFKHPPNVDAVHWLKQEIVPAFRRLSSHPQVEFHVFGSYMNARALKLDDPAMGFRVLGAAESVHETLSQYRLSVAPLRFGAGIKGKIADSWFNGTPVVTTCVGTEGMAWRDDDNSRSQQQPEWAGGLVANDTVGFAQAVDHLYHDEQLWNHKQQSAIETVTSYYDAARNQQQLLAALNRAREELQVLRQRNWMGKILWSEHFRATEYMSRYIQAKNAPTTRTTK